MSFLRLKGVISKQHASAQLTVLKKTVNEPKGPPKPPGGDEGEEPRED